MLITKAKSEKLWDKFNEFLILIEGSPYAGQLSMSFDVHMGNFGLIADPRLIIPKAKMEPISFSFFIFVMCYVYQNIIHEYCPPFEERETSPLSSHLPERNIRH